jgi:hypothetical protein
VLDDLKGNRVAAAERTSATLSAAVADAFAAVKDVPVGNAFTNANKALAHVMAFGPQSRQAPAPRLHAGTDLPRSVLDRVEQSLARHGLLPDKGYFDDSPD